MNSKARRLDPLILRAEEREAAAAREFAAKTRALGQHEERLADLVRYSDEYAQTGSGNTSPALLANREMFRGKLKQAVQLQQVTVEQSRRMAEFERTRLMVAARDTKVLEKLAANYRLDERRRQEKVEQKAMDEHAARIHRRGNEGESD